MPLKVCFLQMRSLTAHKQRGSRSSKRLLRHNLFRNMVGLCSWSCFIFTYKNQCKYNLPNVTSSSTRNRIKKKFLSLMDIICQLIGSSKIFIQEGDCGGEGAKNGRGGKNSGIIVKQGLLSKHTWVYIDWKLTWSSLKEELIERMGNVNPFHPPTWDTANFHCCGYKSIHRHHLRDTAGSAPDHHSKASIAIK